jgi:hypothetical protein
MAKRYPTVTSNKMTSEDLKLIVDMIADGMKSAFDAYRKEALTLVTSLVRQHLETEMRDEILHQVQRRLERGITVTVGVEPDLLVGGERR